MQPSSLTATTSRPYHEPLVDRSLVGANIYSHTLEKRSKAPSSQKGEMWEVVLQLATR